MNRYLDNEPELSWRDTLKLLGLEMLRFFLTMAAIGLWAFLAWGGYQ